MCVCQCFRDFDNETSIHGWIYIELDSFPDSRQNTVKEEKKMDVSNPSPFVPLQRKKKWVEPGGYPTAFRE